MSKASFSLPSTQTQLKKTWQLAWPVILANLSLPLLGIADAAILGHLDDSVYLSGVTIGASLMAYIFWGFNFLSMGISGFTSQAFGKIDHAEIILLLKKYSLVATTLIIVLLIFHSIFIKVGLDVISAQSNIRTEAEIYLSIRMFGVPAIVFNSMLLGFFIGLQNTKIGLYTLSVTQILNIGLNLLFVFGFGFQTAGIAIGSVIAEYLGLMLILWNLRRTVINLDRVIDVHQKLKIQWAFFKPIFHVSSHLFVRTFILLSAFLWFNKISATFAEPSLAANGLLLTFFTLIAHFLDGTAAAAEAQTGEAYGKNDPQLLKLVWFVSGLMTAGFMIFLSLSFWLFGEQLLRALTDQIEVLVLAQEQLTMVILLPITGGIAFWLDGVFVGARRSKDMRNSVIAGFTVFIGLSWFWAETNTALWLCFNCFFLIRSFWLLTIFYKKML